MGDPTIALIKQQLLRELGSEKFSIYMGLLRDWFGERLTKDMFDYEVLTVFDERSFKLHNLLFQSILLLCATGNVGNVSFPQSIVPEPASNSTVGIPCPSNTSKTPLPAFETQYRSHEDDMYIIPPIPGEEPFLYPPNAKEYPRQAIEVQGAVDMMEQDPPADVDWLHSVDVTFPATENSESQPLLKCRFPPWLAHEVQCVNTKSYLHEINVVPNVTHFLNTKDVIERKPQLKPHFYMPSSQKTPFLSSGCSVYGRILIKAWKNDIQTVDPLITEYAVNTVRDHMKNVILGIIQQRRAFRMRDKRLIHSIGVPYPNPYLRQGFHMYDEAYSSDSAKMADVVMQVPSPFPSLDEKDRLAALQVSSTYPTKESRFISAKGTMADFLCAIQNNPALIPYNTSRVKLVDTILRNYKGFAGSQNSQYNDYEEEDLILESSPMLPIASY